MGAVSERRAAKSATSRQLPSRCSENHSLLSSCLLIQSTSGRGVHGGAAGLHQVAGQAVTRGRVDVQHLETGGPSRGASGADAPQLRAAHTSSSKLRSVGCRPAGVILSEHRISVPSRREGNKATDPSGNDRSGASMANARASCGWHPGLADHGGTALGDLKTSSAYGVRRGCVQELVSCYVF